MSADVDYRASYVAGSPCARDATANLTCRGKEFPAKHLRESGRVPAACEFNMDRPKPASPRSTGNMSAANAEQDKLRQRLLQMILRNEQQRKQPSEVTRP